MRVSTRPESAAIPCDEAYHLAQLRSYSTQIPPRSSLPRSCPCRDSSVHPNEAWLDASHSASSASPEVVTPQRMSRRRKFVQVERNTIYAGCDTGSGSNRNSVSWREDSCFLQSSIGEPQVASVLRLSNSVARCFDYDPRSYANESMTPSLYLVFPRTRRIFHKLSSSIAQFPSHSTQNCLEVRQPANNMPVQASTGPIITSPSVSLVECP